MSKKKEEVNDNLNNFLLQVEKKYGKGQVMRLDSDDVIDIERFSSGSYYLDKILGGGYPLGKIIELFGTEGGGKSTLAIHAVVENQKKYKDKMCGYIDAEHTFDKEYAKIIGVDYSRFYLNQPDFGEQGADIMEYMIRSGVFSLIVVDSVAALTPKCEIDGEVGESKMGVHARMMSQIMRKMTAIANNNRCTLIFINQLREKIGVMFGNPETTTGGRALKFYSTIRLRVARVGNIKEGEDIVGQEIKIKTEKNKTFPPFKETTTNLMFGLGLDSAWEILNLCIDKNIINKGGSWFSYGDTKLGQGERNVINLLNDNPELLTELISKL